MTDIEKKALEQAVAAAGRRMQDYAIMAEGNVLRQSIVAHARAIEQHEAFRQEVSDAITGFDEYGTEAAWERLSRFIIAKPDPLVEVIATALREGSPFDEDGSHDYTAEAKAVASAIRARGLEVRKIGESE